MDIRTPEQRRFIMQSVRTENTGPEWVVRRLLHGLGYRFRLHRRDLPGTPDIVLPRYKVAIFVHGCFWHRHDCPKGRPPRSRPEYWLPKLDRNARRDKANMKKLDSIGWMPVVVWQCETKDPAALRVRLNEIMKSSTRPSKLPVEQDVSDTRELRRRTERS